MSLIPRLIKDYVRGGKGIRTPDPLHAMQVLYQLSYTPKELLMLAVRFLSLFIDAYDH